MHLPTPGEAAAAAGVVVLAIRAAVHAVVLAAAHTAVLAAALPAVACSFAGVQI